jgi:hypothetical protein
MSGANVLSAIAILLSAISLGWQALSWWWEGARIAGWLAIEDTSSLGNAVVVVHVINTGRSAATVTDMRSPVTRKGAVGSSNAIRRLAESDPVPCRIEAGGHATWRYPIVTGLTSSEAMEFPYAELRVVVTVNNRSQVALRM